LSGKNKELLKASQKGDVEEVKKLLKEGAYVNAKDEYGFYSFTLSS
jgi:hypothetical protein